MEKNKMESQRKIASFSASSLHQFQVFKASKVEWEQANGESSGGPPSSSRFNGQELSVRDVLMGNVPMQDRNRILLEQQNRAREAADAHARSLSVGAESRRNGTEFQQMRMNGSNGHYQTGTMQPGPNGALVYVPNTHHYVDNRREFTDTPPLLAPGVVSDMAEDGDNDSILDSISSVIQAGKTITHIRDIQKAAQKPIPPPKSTPKKKEPCQKPAVAPKLPNVQVRPVYPIQYLVQKTPNQKQLQGPQPQGPPPKPATRPPLFQFERANLPPNNSNTPSTSQTQAVSPVSHQNSPVAISPITVQPITAQPVVNKPTSVQQVSPVQHVSPMQQNSAQPPTVQNPQVVPLQSNVPLRANVPSPPQHIAPMQQSLPTQTVAPTSQPVNTVEPSIPQVPRALPTMSSGSTLPPLRPFNPAQRFMPQPYVHRQPPIQFQRDLPMQPIIQRQSPTQQVSPMQSSPVPTTFPVQSSSSPVQQVTPQVGATQPFFHQPPPQFQAYRPESTSNIHPSWGTRPFEIANEVQQEQQVVQQMDLVGPVLSQQQQQQQYHQDRVQNMDLVGQVPLHQHQQQPEEVVGQPVASFIAPQASPAPQVSPVPQPSPIPQNAQEQQVTQQAVPIQPFNQQAPQEQPIFLEHAAIQPVLPVTQNLFPVQQNLETSVQPFNQVASPVQQGVQHSPVQSVNPVIHTVHPNLPENLQEPETNQQASPVQRITSQRTPGQPIIHEMQIVQQAIPVQAVIPVQSTLPTTSGSIPRQTVQYQQSAPVQTVIHTQQVVIHPVSPIPAAESSSRTIGRPNKPISPVQPVSQNPPEAEVIPESPPGSPLSVPEEFHVDKRSHKEKSSKIKKVKIPGKDDHKFKRPICDRENEEASYRLFAAMEIKSLSSEEEKQLLKVLERREREHERLMAIRPHHKKKYLDGPIPKLPLYLFTKFRIIYLILKDYMSLKEIDRVIDDRWEQQTTELCRVYQKDPKVFKRPRIRISWPPAYSLSRAIRRKMDEEDDDDVVEPVETSTEAQSSSSSPRESPPKKMATKASRSKSRDTKKKDAATVFRTPATPPAKEVRVDKKSMSASESDSEEEVDDEDDNDEDYNYERDIKAKPSTSSSSKKRSEKRTKSTNTAVAQILADVEVPEDEVPEEVGVNTEQAEVPEQPVALEQNVVPEQNAEQDPTPAPALAPPQGSKRRSAGHAGEAREPKQRRSERLKNTTSSLFSRLTLQAAQDEEMLDIILENQDFIMGDDDYEDEEDEMEEEEEEFVEDEEEVVPAPAGVVAPTAVVAPAAEVEAPEEDQGIEQPLPDYEEVMVEDQKVTKPAEQVTDPSLDFHDILVNEEDIVTAEQKPKPVRKAVARKSKKKAPAKPRKDNRGRPRKVVTEQPTQYVPPAESTAPAGPPTDRQIASRTKALPVAIQSPDFINPGPAPRVRQNVARMEYSRRVPDNVVKSLFEQILTPTEAKNVEIMDHFPSPVVRRGMYNRGTLCYAISTYQLLMRVPQLYSIVRSHLKQHRRLYDVLIVEGKEGEKLIKSIANAEECFTCQLAVAISERPNARDRPFDTIVPGLDAKQQQCVMETMQVFFKTLDIEYMMDHPDFQCHEYFRSSPVRKFFEIDYVLNYECTMCGYKKANDDKSVYVSVNLTKRTKLSMQNLADSLYKPSKVTGLKCDNCESTLLTVYYSFKSLPDVLLYFVPRIKEYGGVKDTTAVILNNELYMRDANQMHKYVLCSYIMHGGCGFGDGGHYKIFEVDHSAYSVNNEFNDSQVFIDQNPTHDFHLVLAMFRKPDAVAKDAPTDIIFDGRGNIVYCDEKHCTSL
ncbi:hypothetical protein B9Z55_023241 [Caenorhabditis nigoni]|uniref:USP domain-containing protein n=1 Tax=Caenorhabditis nigoni TaxID=1611254 RepID=A0A2G5SP03_9PELO|nr:hypothetical protein B9Z55_023241 [Caenorhabditis nigoni]